MKRHPGFSRMHKVAYLNTDRKKQTCKVGTKQEDAIKQLLEIFKTEKSVHYQDNILNFVIVEVTIKPDNNSSNLPRKLQYISVGAT